MISAWAQAVVQDLLLADFIQILDVDQVPRARWWSMSISSVFARLFFRCMDAAYRLKNDPLAPRLLPKSLENRRSAELLDVCVDLCDSGNEWQRPARHGVWTLQLGEPGPDPGWPPFSAEMLRGDARRRVELLQRQAPGLPQKLLCHADFPSNPYPSARANLIDPLWGASHFFLRKLNELHRAGTVKVDACASAEPVLQASCRPRLLDALRWLASQTTKRIANRFRHRVSNPVWHIAIRRSRTPLPESPTAEAIRSFRWMEELGTPAADPFLFEEGGKLWLFFESIDRHSGKGHISCGWLDADGRLQQKRSVLNLPTHLSYPHLVREGGDIYMLPESASSGGLDLYRASRFPDEWEKVGRLLDFPCVDSTVFRHADAWWMFTSPMASGSFIPATWLFRAERLEGPWEYQLCGPVCCSAENAREAGEVFELGGRLIRPAQDCSRSYGHALVFNEILSLSMEHYQECPLCRVESRIFPGMVGLHTYNRVGDWEVIDGLFADGHQPPENLMPASRQAREA